MTFYLWSQTASNNDTADPTANLREGWSPSIVNNAIRALMAAAAKFRDDISGILLTTGTSAAYAVTSNQGLTDDTPDGFTVTFRAHTTNDAGATLEVDAQGDAPLRIATGVDLKEGVLVEGNVYKATYVSADDEWMLHGFYDTSTIINIPFVLGDGSNVISTGLQNSIGPFDFDFEILAWSLLGTESGSISVDLLSCTYTQWDGGSTHPASGDKISASAPMTYSSAKKGTSSTLTGWTTAVASGAILTPNVASVTSSKRVYGMLKARKTS